MRCLIKDLAVSTGHQRGCKCDNCVEYGRAKSKRANKAAADRGYFQERRKDPEVKAMERESNRAWRKANPDKARAYDARNRRKWNKIRPSYMKADFMTRMTAAFMKTRPDGHHLDHIHPISTGGKHTPWNWAWSPAQENLKKHNKFIGMTENAVSFNEAMDGLYFIKTYIAERAPQHGACLLPGIPASNYERSIERIGG